MEGFTKAVGLLGLGQAGGVAAAGGSGRHRRSTAASALWTLAIKLPSAAPHLQQLCGGLKGAKNLVAADACAQ